MGDNEITACALAAGHGDDEALTAFVRGTQAGVWRYLAYLACREHADDLTQETYLRAIQSLPRFRGDTAARPWLMSIARRTAMDHVRQLRRSLPIAGATEVAHACGVPIGTVRSRVARAREDLVGWIAPAAEDEALGEGREGRRASA